MKDTRTALLVMLSAGLIGTWIYHLADKAHYSKQRKEIFIKDSIAVAQGVQDSLTKIYSQTLSQLGSQLDSSKNTQVLLKTELREKLAEIYKLRTEINAILKKNSITKTDIDLARKKTIELQMLVNELQNKNSSIEAEKQQITSMLDKVNIQVKNLEAANQQLGQENKVLHEKLSQAATFIATDIKLSPVTVKNEKEQETSLARKTIKFVVSMTLVNNMADYENADIYVVITEPDGRLLSNDVWESAALIDTKNDGKKRYTRKVRFEYHKGEKKNLIFSINADEYKTGNYTLQLYHNGYMIGQTSRKLS